MFVYLFFRLDGRPYYVGLTRNQNRARNTWNRNTLCNGITERIKRSGQEPGRRVIECPSSERAGRLEKYLISRYGRISEGGMLANHLPGGTTHTEESLELLSRVHSGKKLSEEHKNKIASARTGKRHSDETKKAHSLRMAGRRTDPLVVLKTRTKIKIRKNKESQDLIRRMLSQGIVSQEFAEKDLESLQGKLQELQNILNQGGQECPPDAILQT